LYIYNGIYPLTISEDSITASDQASNESVLANITFRFDGAPFDLGTVGVKELAAAAFSDYNYADTYKILGTTIP